jgi:acetyl esterase/lipase
MVCVIRAVVALPQRIGFSTRDLSKDVPQSELKKSNSRFVRIDGLEDSEIVGEIRDFAKQAGIQPVSVPCFWFLKKGFEWVPRHEKAGEDEKVILHIHGGAFLVS